MRAERARAPLLKKGWKQRANEHHRRESEGTTVGEMEQRVRSRRPVIDLFAPIYKNSTRRSVLFGGASGRGWMPKSRRLLSPCGSLGGTFLICSWREHQPASATALALLLRPEAGIKSHFLWGDRNSFQVRRTIIRFHPSRIVNSNFAKEVCAALIWTSRLVFDPQWFWSFFNYGSKIWEKWIKIYKQK